ILHQAGVSQDVAMHVAVGTSLAAIVFNSLRSAAAHNKRGALDWPILRRYGPFVFLGAILGAGYDSRALRLAHHIKNGIWEFDFPATQRRKKFYLRNERIEGEIPHYCEVDFMKESLPEIFERSGMEKTATLVIWEGVSMYVSEDVVRNTLLACREYFGEGTIVVFDYWHNTVEDPFRNLVIKVMPMVMDMIYSERFTYGATAQQMRELALSCGARRFESLSGKQVMKKLFLTSRLPLTSASMAVVEF
ncbi:MAG TPA: TSUP family transporter, partial [Turneriella sp.]|nr:TSUP family transporter [Turneriella sp.]